MTRGETEFARRQMLRAYVKSLLMNERPMDDWQDGSDAHLAPSDIVDAVAKLD